MESEIHENFADQFETAYDVVINWPSSSKDHKVNLTISFVKNIKNSGKTVQWFIIINDRQTIEPLKPFRNYQFFPNQLNIFHCVFP